MMTFTFDPRLFAKATVGPALGLLGAVATWVATGHLDQHSLLYFGAGLVGGIITYFVPNAASEVQAVDAAFAPTTADDVVQPAAWLAARQPDAAATQAPVAPVVAPPAPVAEPPAGGVA